MRMTVNADMEQAAIYTDEFYGARQKSARRSAREIVPLVLNLMKPQSVIDVGCGVGTWLSVFKEYGVENFLGVDGDWLDKRMLEIPEERFLSFDLNQPFYVDKTFDLVVSLEVAEHLLPDSAETFIDSLTQLAPVILFSAAIPHQGGTSHVNERWPDYWTKHFGDRGYAVVDCIREKVWDNDNVDWWYAQNTLVYAKWDYLQSHAELENEYRRTRASQLAIVHPKKYLHAMWMYQVLMASRDIAEVIPSDESFILVDQGQFGSEFTEVHRVLPFLEKDGCYWGPPPDNSTAIDELERQRRSGAKFIVFGWPAFWWLDHYTELSRHLRTEYRCVLENERVIVFDIRSRAGIFP
jgi:cyclopropane fatty-acyl-phospholipid synthase-like methyltransferase